MSENDYIAEYVKEKHPEIVNSFDFKTWRLVKCMSKTVEGVSNALDVFIDSFAKGFMKVFEESEDEDV